MILNYIKIAWRNLMNNRKSAFINISGLSIGMAVFILISLWIWDGLTFNHYHQNHDRIGQIWQTQELNGQRFSGISVPIPLGPELKNNYQDQLESVVMASWVGNHVLSHEDKNLTKSGIYMDTDGPKIFTLDILSGSIHGLNDPSSIMISASTAKSFFGDMNPINQLMKIDQRLDVRVTAVYGDLPQNTTLSEVTFIAPWSLYLTSEPWLERSKNQWDNNSFQCFVQIPEQSTFDQVNAATRDAKLKKVSDAEKKFNAQLHIHPMNDWYLYEEWKDGRPVGGMIDYIKLFAIIGLFVLALACINFMNLSTARSERRAKEVGIRKTVGSSRRLLILQFLSESILIAMIAFAFAMVLTLLILPWFNSVTGKQLTLPWSNWIFWLISLLFTIFTGLIAGSYPAFFLSSFQPLRVLKGTFKAGRFAGLPRKVLVVFQFSISLTLVIGTLIVFRQIQHTKDRPTGYDSDRLMMINMLTPDFYGKYDVLRHSLKQKNLIEEMSESSSPLTEVWSNSGGFEWEGKDPNLTTDFAVIAVTHDYGNTINWQIESGRDFSRDFSTDSSGIIINEAAIEFMGLENPLGKKIRWFDKDLYIIGTIKDIVMSSPFRPVKQAIYYLDYEGVNWINIRLNNAIPTAEAIAGIAEVFHEVIPHAPFEYKFADSEYATKFAIEERIGKTATIFATFAIIISCLGVFGLASFVAEKRTKEIGIRKVVGASNFELWRLLSVNFLLLVSISCLIASPIAYFGLNTWLDRYAYRTSIPAWIFILTILGGLLITLIVVSFQTFKVVKMNPVDSLRDE